jgi:hypothetical protein
MDYHFPRVNLPVFDFRLLPQVVQHIETLECMVDILPSAGLSFDFTLAIGSAPTRAV